MTEAQWLVSESPVKMLNSLGVEKFSRLALRYALAVCGQRPDLLVGPLREWAETAERVADTYTNGDPFVDIQLSAEEVACELTERGPPGTRGHYAALADAVVGLWTFFKGECDQVNTIPREELTPVRQATAAFVRDIIGNPFRPGPFYAGWRTASVVAIARQVYESQDFTTMPILADALLDAGCDYSDLLAHCREPSPHVRGCWALDLVLGKE